mgnify:FL=1
MTRGCGSRELDTEQLLALRAGPAVAPRGLLGGGVFEFIAFIVRVKQ